MTTRAPRHVRTLDSMRAISALVVLASHLVQIFWLPVVGLHNPVHFTSNFLSESAVIVFFLLSGYLIAMSIWRNFAKNGHFSHTEYAVSRLARIYPPLLCAVAIAIGIFYLIGFFSLPGGADPLRQAQDLYAAREILQFQWGELASALMLRGGLLDINGPLWSLYIEVALYAAAGALAMAILGRAWPSRMLGILLFLAICYAVRRDYQLYGLYSAWWLLGVTFFLSQLDERRKLVTLSAAILPSAAILYLTGTDRTIEAMRIPAMLGLSCLMFFVWQWESKLLERIAGFSYTLYSIHFPILIPGYSIFLHLEGNSAPAGADRMLASLLSTSAALGASWILGRYVENAGFFRKLGLATLFPKTRTAK